MAQVIEFETIKKDFARRLRERREELGLSQQNACREIHLDLSLGAYQAWENPKKMALPKGKYAIALEVHFGVPLIGPNHPIPAEFGDSHTARYLTPADLRMPAGLPELALAGG